MYSNEPAAKLNVPSHTPSPFASDSAYVPHDHPSDGPVAAIYPGVSPVQFISTVRVTSYIHEPSSVVADAS